MRLKSELYKKEQEEFKMFKGVKYYLDKHKDWMFD